MADVIQLLPDSIANQIAAGEVIQRPASVVKELMENAIDAGSTDVKLIIKNAGKTLIQVVDNGCGMSATDARLSFERHATSKIRSAKDLFSIRTMGFRGEALASIASVAQVEMKTKRQIDELGTRIVIEGSEVKAQEPCQTSSGTSFSVKNLFFNIPARRNFLKSDNVEMKHIIEEFQRIALAHADVFFSLHHNDNELFHLPPGNFRQRVTGVLGNNANKKLVPVFEETDVVKLQGFVGKPEYAKKKRGDQWFFVNSRFIKSSYLHQAVTSAFENLLPQDTHPLYIIFIDIDPSRIDINVHPTKQEIKFEDDKLVHNYLRVAIRHALGQHSITPSLDFDQEVSFSTNHHRPFPDDSAGFPGFSSNKVTSNSVGQSDQQRYRSNLANWEKLYEGLKETEPEEEPQTTTLFSSVSEDLPAITIESELNSSQPTTTGKNAGIEQSKPFQIHNTYILSQIKSGFILIDQQNAHERILYEHFYRILNQQEPSTQQQLFPKTIQLSISEAELLKSILPEVNKLGFDIQEFGSDTFVVNGLPAILADSLDERKMIETLLEQYQQNQDLKLGANEGISKAMAKSTAIRRGQALTSEGMKALIDQLFACELPFKSPSGKNCFVTYSLEDLTKRFDS